VSPVRKRTCDVAEKLTTNKISLQGRLQEFFRAGLNEIKYDYVDSKQHFYLQYHVAATDMKALRKKTNDT